MRGDGPAGGDGGDEPSEMEPPATAPGGRDAPDDDDARTARPDPLDDPLDDPPSGGALVEVEGLGKRYGTQWAVRDVSFEITPGTVFGIIGPNGAGKTTILKILAGILEPTEGRTRVGGREVRDPDHRARIGYLPEESALYEDMTPLSYLRFFADLFDVPRLLADERIDRVLSELGLKERDGKRIGDLSKGMRRKVAIARSLVNDPALLIYDEPASGLDPVVSATILDLVREFRDRGKTILLSAHNLYHMEQVCDEVLILHEGRVAVAGTLDEIRQGVGGTEYRVVTSVPLDGSFRTEHGHELVVNDLGRVKDIEEQAKAAGGHLIEVRSKELSLEEIFLKTTGGSAAEPAEATDAGTGPAVETGPGDGAGVEAGTGATERTEEAG